MSLRRLLLLGTYFANTVLVVLFPALASAQLDPLDISSGGDRPIIAQLDVNFVDPSAIGTSYGSPWRQRIARMASRVP